MVTKKVKIKLQGHEKFALREGWINKALMILPENPISKRLYHITSNSE